jgi:hypothetical protein
MFLKTHDVALLAEDDRMERLDRITKEWWQKMGCDKKQTENKDNLVEWAIAAHGMYESSWV